MQHDHAEMPRLPKTEPEVNLHDVIGQTLGTNVGRHQWLYDVLKPNSVYVTGPETDNHHGGTCQIHVSWKSKMAATDILKFEKCQYLRIAWTPTNLVDRCIAAVWRWSHDQRSKPGVNLRDVSLRVYDRLTNYHTSIVHCAGKHVAAGDGRSVRGARTADGVADECNERVEFDAGNSSSSADNHRRPTGGSQRVAQVGGRRQQQRRANTGHGRTDSAYVARWANPMISTDLLTWQCD